MKILTAKQINQVDRRTTTQFGIPSLLLMENAGMNLYLALEDYFDDLSQQRIAIICGKGNNGGDGIVLARQLAQRGIHPDVYLLGKVSDLSGDARTNLDIYLKAKQPVQEVSSSREWAEYSDGLTHYSLIVDALLGTGISKNLEGLYSDVVSTINLTDAFVLSVDIPSGMFSDSLEGGVQTVLADATVTFTAPKVAHILNEDQEAIGDLRIVPIGSPVQLLDRPAFCLNLITREWVCSRLRPREIGAHKGNFGHVAIVSGSLGKAGAAALCASAALRAGSGLVTIYTPDLIQHLVASFRPESMTEGLASTPRGTFASKGAERLLDLFKERDAAGIGPGMTTERQTVRFIHQVVQNAKIPLLLDADALNAFEGHAKKLTNRHGQPLILTPHPGEFSRLAGQTTKKVLAKKVEMCRQFAQHHKLWVVLKGFRTLIATPDGQVFVCPLGNPGMATAGMGDALTGVLTSLLGLYAARQMIEPEEITEALSVGVYLHSLAGDLAVARTSQEALTAGDVIDHLGEAYRNLTEAEA